ncbi:hypothetical protein SDC9_88823 [bioreactor metagenome]|uniref:Uncharacterized protein n=1 Tax=bioreactor metagenome TaxID=1076179 RepID=A0A644ZQK0_9ZZZZ
MRVHECKVCKQYRTEGLGIGNGRGVAENDILQNAFKGVPHRKDAQPSLTGSEFLNQLGHRLKLVGKVVVGKHHALWITGGATSEDDCCNLFNGTLLAFFLYLDGNLAIIEQASALIDEVLVEQDFHSFREDDVFKLCRRELPVHDYEGFQLRKLVN